MPEPTLLNKREVDLLAHYRNASPIDQHMLLVVSYFLAGKHWTTAMQQQLELLAALCTTA